MFFIEMSRSTVQKLGFSYITPRPLHYKQDKKELKKLTKTVNSSIKKGVFSFDELRFGTHSKIGHGWLTIVIGLNLHII